ncbi:MAG TPA: response regulator [Anaeromyxobacter sp.]|nr:response regulator [Anaeromyxobacter sp.]
MNLDAATRARLVGLFVAEADETVAALRDLAEGLTAGARGDVLREFGRIAHGLKGAAAALGYEGLARALHDLEDLALGVRDERPAGAEERRRRVGEALDLVSEGTARMGASGADAFPEDLLERLLDVVAPGRAAADAAAGAERDASAPAAPDGAPSPAAPRAPEAGERISVPATDVDAALRLASSLARGAAQLHEALQRAGGDLAHAAQSLANGAAGLEGIVASLRLLPAEAALSGLEEEVDGLAAHLGKRVALGITGRDVRADRRSLQSARGMIRHLVRNALDHGIEPEADRIAAGKEAEGHLSVAVHAGESTLRVTVSDDGAGFDAAAIRGELARRTGDPERIASLSDEEVLRAWAFEGGSTRSTATRISGRGLGLSAVAQLARASGGGIRILSARGEGSIVEFTLPLEVYAVEALTVSAGGRLFGVPLGAVERTVHAAGAGDAIHEGAAGPTLAAGETILPLCDLGEVLGLARAPDRLRRDAGAVGAARFAVVVRHEASLAALAVDDLGGVEGMVPATVAGVAQADALVTGIARLGDGSAVAVLNPRHLVDRARAVRPRPRPAAAPSRAAAAPAGALDVVLAEDSLATREVLRVLLEEQGFRVRVAADGEEALQRVVERAPDVLVSDVNMPRRDGLALTRALRARVETERLPIVLLTSQDDEATRAEGAAAGADAYLLKARFDAGVLQQTLARIGVRSG